MLEDLYLYERLVEKEMFLSLLTFQSISVTMSIKQARPIDACVGKLI